MANRRSNVLHLMAPWEKASFNDRNSTELRAVYIDPRLATVASNLRLGQNHELDVAKLLPPRSNSYIRELDSQRLVASVLDGPWRSTTYSDDDKDSIEQAASDDVAMLRSLDRTLYAANEGVSDLCPGGDKRSCMIALLKDKQEGTSCFHLAASPDGGIGGFDVTKNDTMVCLGDRDGAEIRALLPDRFSSRVVYVWRPAGDEQGFAPSIDCVTTVDTLSGQCIDSVPVHSASYYGMDFREESGQQGKDPVATTKLVSITYDYQRWQTVLRSYVVENNDSPVSSEPEFKSVLFTSRGPFWVLDSPEVSDGFVIVVAGTEPQIGILHAAPLYDAQIGPASNQWMKQGDVLRRENTRSAYYRHVSGKVVDESVAEPTDPPPPFCIVVSSRLVELPARLDGPFVPLLPFCLFLILTTKVALRALTPARTSKGLHPLVYQLYRLAKSSRTAVRPSSGEILSMLDAATTAVKDSFTPDDLSVLAWSVGRIGHASPSFWRVAANLAEVYSQDFTPRASARLLEAFASAGETARDPPGEPVTDQGVCQLLRALVKLRRTEEIPAWMVQQGLHHLEGSTEEGVSSRSLVPLMWPLSRIPSAADKAASIVAMLIRGGRLDYTQMTTTNVALLIHALGKAWDTSLEKDGEAPPPYRDVLSQLVTECGVRGWKGLSPHAIAGVLWACGRCTVTSLLEECSDDWHPLMEVELRDFDPQALANVLWGIGRINRKQLPSWLTPATIEAALLHQGPKADLFSLSMMACALAYEENFDVDSLFDALWRSVRDLIHRRLHGSNTGDLAALLWAFSRRGHSEAAKDLAAVCEHHLRSLSLDLRAMALWGMANAGHLLPFSHRERYFDLHSGRDDLLINGHEPGSSRPDVSHTEPSAAIPSALCGSH
ncbi:hypothetical protein FOZ60_010355 [Perkinsus olseni]|uniref:Uncharacterized protein n=1 Tax=Perkinsus olseni TaxID=32597 RepID=A0A7J6PCH5_PEROL|nr:hypothetical protein FOZ60_010355 [Perkinsus olseni]